MDTLDYILVGLIVVVIILLVYSWWSSRDKKKRKHARDLADTSAGGYDEYAQEALEEIETIEPDNRTIEDNYRAGTILEYNFLNGETENAPRGVMTNILQHYIRAMERAADVARARRDQVNRALRDRGEEHPDAEAAEAQPIDIIVMTDHIEDFTDQDIEINPADVLMGGLINVLAEHVRYTAPVVRETERETRRVTAAAAADNRAEAITEYMQATTTHTSDTQNVHDSHVNEDLRATLTSIEPSLKRDTTLQVAIAGMSEFLLECDLEPKQRRLVFKSLEIVGKNAYIGTLQSTEGHVFKCVWDRAEDPANALNEKLIKEALATALAEFWENGDDHAPVCINGRCSRMLASLVLLDFDDRAGAVQTKEMVKNEVIDDATKIINAEIDRAAESDDEARRKVGQAYKDPKVVPDEKEEEKFVEELKQKISNMMNLNYRDKLSTRDYENVKEDIFAGL